MIKNEKSFIEEIKFHLAFGKFYFACYDACVKKWFDIVFDKCETDSELWNRGEWFHELSEAHANIARNISAEEIKKTFKKLGI